jgi:hypothetical protein
MIHPISGIYAAPVRGVERVTGQQTQAAQGYGAQRGRPPDMLAYDSVRVASISDAASRTTSYQVAVRNLDEIGTYLNELF